MFSSIIGKPDTTLPVRLLLAMLATTLISGCDTASYYYQAVNGQVKILNAREPVDKILKDPDTDPELKERLDYIVRVKSFATDTLGLPATDSYTSYVDLQRRFAVWNVFAAGEFSVQPETWCFPVAGCTAYRGYFDKSDAIAFESDLKSQGYDTYSGSVAAYSTLGWFDDPVLNTFFNRNQEELAALIFHEMTHQLIYVKGDSSFNEGLATTVEQAGLQQWLIVEGKPALFDQYTDKRQFHQEVVALINTNRGKRKSLYLSSIPTTEKRLRKKQLVNELRENYGALKTRLDRNYGYDNWFQKDLNNAQLTTITTYNELVPGFNRLLTLLNHNLPAFYDASRHLASLDKEERHRILKGIAGGGNLQDYNLGSLKAAYYQPDKTL